MLLALILLPLIGYALIMLFINNNEGVTLSKKSVTNIKTSVLLITIVNLFISFNVWVLLDNSSKYFQFVQEKHTVSNYDFYLGIDGLSIYFVLLTTLIMPISIMSNWKLITEKSMSFLWIILLLESALLIIYLVLDSLMFYIFFESILAPLFILIGLYGSSDRIRASFYFFLYTFLGSLFMLLSIITFSSMIGCTDFFLLTKTDYIFIIQLSLFIGIFIAVAVKTPVIYLNNWLLKAHVESPLSGSIILAAIVLKLALYGILRLILPIVPEALIYLTYIVLAIVVLTIGYASLSTLRSLDIKELIAYSSVSHAAVYLGGLISNTLHGIQGAITLGLAHGFVSSGLFISAGGVLYDRSSTRVIGNYKGLAQMMPIFAIIFFILSLGNCGAPLTLNFVGEFMSLYGIFERLPLAGASSSSSIIFSAAFTIFLFNRICFGGYLPYNKWDYYLPDLNKREYTILLTLVLFTVILGIYPSIILDSLHYYTYWLIFNFNYNISPYFFDFFNTYAFAPNLESIEISVHLPVLQSIDISTGLFDNIHEMVGPNLDPDFNPNWYPGIAILIGGILYIGTRVVHGVILMSILSIGVDEAAEQVYNRIRIVTFKFNSDDEATVYTEPNIDAIEDNEDPYHLVLCPIHHVHYSIVIPYLPNTINSQLRTRIEETRSECIRWENLFDASNIERRRYHWTEEQADSVQIPLLVEWKVQVALLRYLEAVLETYDTRYVSPYDVQFFED